MQGSLTWEGPRRVLKLQFRDASSSFLAPLLWTQPRIKGKNLLQELFPQLQGQEGAGGVLPGGFTFPLSFSGLC